MRPLLTLLLAFVLIAPATAIELTLEENRAEHGTIGYIDMQRLFKMFPDTVRAKENFEEVVRQAEEQLNLRKAEILRARNELSQLKIEREFIARTLIVDISTGAAAAPQEKDAEEKKPAAPAKPAEAARSVETPKAVELPKPSETPKPVEPPAKPAAMSLALLPGLVSTDTAKSEAKKPEALTINIPGVSTGPIVVQPPEIAAAPRVSTVPFATQPFAAAATTRATVPATETPSVNPALIEIDGKIAVKARDLAQKESDFKDQQASAEKNLLDLESRKTEILLGKIYKAVQVVARKEGVSVVVDKGNILYGHDAVDLTEKVLKLLKGEQP